MADSSSYRPSRAGLFPPRREETPPDGDRHPASDPLAELARLIGQDETLRELTRNSTRPGPQPERPARAAEEPHTPPWLARSGPPLSEWRDEQDRPDDPYAPAADPAHADRQWDATAAEHDAPATHAADDAHGMAGHTATEHGAPPYEGTHEQGAYYGDDEHMNPEGEDDYVEDIPDRRRGGLTTVAAVLGLALLGTAGAFGYWSWSSGSGGSSEPPLIKADPTPSKIVPATQSGDISNKRIVDRITEKGPSAGERVVSREEQPVDVKPPAPRQIFPGFGSVSGPGQTAQAAPPSGVPASAEPRKVKTETIRPERVASVDAGASSGPLPPPRPVATTVIQGPGAAPSQSGTAKSNPRPGPLVLGSTGPAESSDAPARSQVPAGSYVVQLSAQRSEEEAQASFRALQAKYPAVLGSRQPLIRRADLGEKGVFYRAQVGPFATQDQASQFCGSLKAAGGQCMVQKN